MSKILLTPGPCMTSEAVRQAAAFPDLNHRDPEYLELIRETKHRLMNNVYAQLGCGWRPFLLGGSGTLAVEAMVTSCINAGPVLLLENGYYSGRVADLLAIHHIPFVSLSHGWLEPWNFERIEAELAKGYETVVGTHNETTTGRLNEIERLGELSRRYRTKCLIDAMSSFGADDIEFSNLDAVCASSNKCLHSIPGVAFVLVRNELAHSMNEFPRRSYYMSLPMYDGDNPPLTPPIPDLAALRQALREFPSHGASERERDYLQKWAFIREALKNRGLTAALLDRESSCTLNTFSLPPGFTFDEWFAANSNAGFVLYGCKGELRERFFQVANMGELTMDDLARWIETVEGILR